MKLYLYDTESKRVLMELEDVISYSDNQVITKKGRVSPLADYCELSAVPDCSETLRAAWRRNEPSDKERLDEIEYLLAKLLFGGEPA